MGQVKPISVPLVPPPSPKKSGDRFVVYLAIATLVFLLAGFCGAWYYLKNAQQSMLRASFIDSGPLVVVIDGWAIAARMSVETGESDSDWASTNKRAIVGVLQKALAESDPTKMRNPAEVEALQSRLKDASNAALGTEKIRNVMFTEFVVKQPV